MDPYREKNPLDAVKEQLDSILKELERLQPIKASPIRDVIANKIKYFEPWEFLWKTFVSLLLVTGVVFVGCLFVLPKQIQSCDFDIKTGDKDPGVYIKVNRDLVPKESWGPFSSLDEAYEYAKLNHCPDLPDKP